MARIRQDGGEACNDAIAICRQGVFEPVKRLHDGHRRSPGPVQLARRCVLEIDLQVVELYATSSGIGADHDVSWDRGSQAEIVRRGQPVDQDADLVAPGQGVNHLSVVRYSGPLRQGADPRRVVQPAGDAAQSAGLRQALENLIDRVPTAKVQKVDGCPDLGGWSLVDAVEEELFEIAHVRYLYTLFGPSTRSVVRKVYTYFRPRVGLNRELG